MRLLIVGLTALATWTNCVNAQEFRIEEVSDSAALAPAQIKPNTIAFNDYRKDEHADPTTGLIRFEDWTKARPLQKDFLSLYPGYVEPRFNVTINGIVRPHKEKLHIYVAEARFVLAKPPQAINLDRYANVDFLSKVDSAIKHKTITAAAAAADDTEGKGNKHPARNWCEGSERLVCIESRYQFEGKLPAGIMLANKLSESGKTVADYLLLKSELKVLSPQEIEQEMFGTLTGIDKPVTGALVHNIFQVNQVMQFGKFLAVFQPHPNDEQKTLVSAYMALAIKSSIFERKKEFESVPVLRNLVPAQVLVGNSSFNTGKSISAGLPIYVRNQIKAIAGQIAAP